MITYKLKNHLTPAQGEKLKGKFLDDNSYDRLITEDADAYDLNGKLLFKFRKNVIPIEVLKNGFNLFL